MTLIALTGKAGAGKDTVRAYLEVKYGFVGYAFADPLRDMAKTLLQSSGVSTAYMTDRALKEVDIPQFGVSYRRIMQTLGTEWGRELVHPDLWVRSVAARFLSDTSYTFGEYKAVVSDLRFQNEEKWVRSIGGKIWRIEREVQAVAAHRSETELDGLKVDAVIMNTGSFQDLHKSIEAALANT